MKHILLIYDTNDSLFFQNKFLNFKVNCDVCFAYPHFQDMKFHFL